MSDLLRQFRNAHFSAGVPERISAGPGAFYCGTDGYASMQPGRRVVVGPVEDGLMMSVEFAAPHDVTLWAARWQTLGLLFVVRGEPGFWTGRDHIQALRAAGVPVSAEHEALVLRIATDTRPSHLACAPTAAWFVEAQAKDAITFVEGLEFAFTVEASHVP